MSFRGYHTPIDLCLLTIFFDKPFVGLTEMSIADEAFVGRQG